MQRESSGCVESIFNARLGHGVNTTSGALKHSNHLYIGPRRSADGFTLLCDMAKLTLTSVYPFARLASASTDLHTAGCSLGALHLIIALQFGGLATLLVLAPDLIPHRATTSFNNIAMAGNDAVPLGGEDWHELPGREAKR